MGIEQYFSVFEIADDSITVGNFSAQRIDKIIRVDSLNIVFSSAQEARGVFEQIKQTIQNLTEDSSVILFQNEYAVISLLLSAVWEYNWVHTTKGTFHFPTHEKAGRYFERLKTKLGNTKIREILPSVGGKVETTANVEEILQQIQDDIQQQIEQRVQEATQVIVEQIVWRREPRNPTVDDIPQYPNTMWINTETGEIFVHIKNCTQENKAVWKGCFGTLIAPFTVDKVDIFGDGSGIALWRFEQNANDEGGRYNGVWVGNEQYDIGRWGYAAKFDGNSGVKVGDYDFSNVKAISLHFNWNGGRGTNNWATLLSSKVINQSGNNIIIAIANSKLATYHNGTTQYVSDQTIEQNRWYHLVVAQTGDQQYTYYLDGVKIAENLPNNNATLDLYYIGSDNNGGSVDEPFTGLIDQVRVFNRVPTEDEVQILKEEKTEC